MKDAISALQARRKELVELAEGREAEAADQQQKSAEAAKGAAFLRSKVAQLDEAIGLLDAHSEAAQPS